MNDNSNGMTFQQFIERMRQAALLRETIKVERAMMNLDIEQGALDFGCDRIANVSDGDPFAVGLFALTFHKEMDAAYEEAQREGQES